MYVHCVIWIRVLTNSVQCFSVLDLDLDELWLHVCMLPYIYMNMEMAHRYM